MVFWIPHLIATGQVDSYFSYCSWNNGLTSTLKIVFFIDGYLCFLKEDEHQYRVIAAILRHVLMLRTETDDKTEEAHRWGTWASHSLLLCCLCPRHAVRVMQSADRQCTQDIERLTTPQLSLSHLKVGTQHTGPRWCHTSGGLFFQYLVRQDCT